MRIEISFSMYLAAAAALVGASPVVAIESSVSVEGRVLVGNKPLPGEQLVFGADGGPGPDGRRETYSTESDAEGVYILDLPPGTWSVGVGFGPGRGPGSAAETD